MAGNDSYRAHYYSTATLISLLKKAACYGFIMKGEHRWIYTHFQTYCDYYSGRFVSKCKVSVKEKKNIGNLERFERLNFEEESTHQV